MATLIDHRKIRTDLEVQSRHAFNEDIVKEYVEAMERGDTFPPIRVIYIDATDEFILVDGFHRLAAHRKCRTNDRIAATIELGTVEDARWVSIGANKKHGLLRSNDDKRNAIKMALLHPKGASLSNVKIAKYAGVSDKTVAAVRRELEESSEIPKSDFRMVHRGSQSYLQNTTNIGQSPHEPVRLCEDCRYFDSKEDYCQCLGEKTVAWQGACEEFLIAVEEKPPREMPEPDYDNIVPYDTNKKRNRKTRLHQNRRLKNCVTVFLPSDDPQLFALELRENFEPSYLLECLVASKELEKYDEFE